MTGSEGPTTRPFCKYLYSNKCKYGKTCRNRHYGPERPTATAYACETYGPRPEDSSTLVGPPGSFTAVLKPSNMATFMDGLTTTSVESLSSLRPQVRVQLVTTALEVTFCVPTRNVWLHYRANDAASRAADALNGQVAHGITLVCTTKESRNGYTFSVQLDGVTDSFDARQIRALLPPDAPKPRKIMLGELTYDPLSSPLDAIESAVKDMTSRPITGSQSLATSNRRKGKILLEFEGSPRLEALARDLNGRVLPQLGKTKIVAVERICAVLTMNGHHYQSYSKRLASLAKDTRRSQDVQVDLTQIAPVGDGGFTYGSVKPVEIMLGAGDRKNLAQAKGAIDALLTSGLAKHVDHLQRPSALQTHRIRLTKTKAYRTVIKGGLEQAKRVVGADVVQLDEESDPPAVIVRGDTATLHRAKAALFADPSLSNHDICAICWDEIEKPVFMPGCCHVACKECFTSYCTVGREAKFPLRCFQSECEEHVPISFLRNNLDTNAIMALMTESMADHFERQPEAYGKCAGADCDAYFKLDDTGDQYICGSCFTITCTTRKVEQHFGENCEQYKERISRSLRQFEEYVAAGNAKKCKCGTVIEKIEGCDHMHCTACGAHFCYSCGETAETAAAVYAHMLSRHGNYGDAEMQALEGEIDAAHEGRVAEHRAMVDGFAARYGAGEAPHIGAWIAGVAVHGDDDAQHDWGWDAADEPQRRRQAPPPPPFRPAPDVVQVDW